MQPSLVLLPSFALAWYCIKKVCQSSPKELTQEPSPSTDDSSLTFSQYISKYPHRIASLQMQLLYKNESALNCFVSILQWNHKDYLLHFMELTRVLEQTMSQDASSVGKLLQHKVVTTVFFEPSTRTHCSFQAAAMRLGAQNLDVNLNHSSTQKGETLEDTMKCLASYSDGLIIRHPDTNIFKTKILPSIQQYRLSVVNAGDGSGEHPTQALLDLYTIWKRKNGNLNNLKVTLVGDLQYGRTVHSLALLLAHFPNITLRYVSMKFGEVDLAMPMEIQQQVEEISAKHFGEVPEARIKQIHCGNVLTEQILAQETDVLYMTRIQKERFHYQSTEESSMQEAMKLIRLDASKLLHCHSSLIILHPLPRNEEISVEVDADERNAYFEQMQNGMYVRMCLLYLLLSM